MAPDQRRERQRGSATTVVFGAGLILLVGEACAYLAGVASPGVAFVLGMLLMLIGALLSAFTDKEKPKADDLVAVFIGICFFAWIGWRSFMQ